MCGLLLLCNSNGLAVYVTSIVSEQAVADPSGVPCSYVAQVGPGVAVRSYLVTMVVNAMALLPLRADPAVGAGRLADIYSIYFKESPPT